MKKKFLDKLRTALKECLEIVDLEHDKLLSKDPDGFYIPRLDNYPVVHFYKDNPFPYIQLYPRICLLYTSPSPRDQRGSRMPSSA